MTGEVAGPPGPKLVRMLYFTGAAVICVVAINKWREFERKSNIQQNDQLSEELRPSVVQEATK